MRVSGFARKLITWIACAAILMGSVAPVLAHALQRSQGGGLIEICTALGSQWVQVDPVGQAGSEPQTPIDHARKHCPLCSSHLTALGMPPAVGSPLLVPALRFGLPELFLSAARTPFAWATAQPRAPPRFS